MVNMRILLHSVFVVLLPLVVAAFGLSFLSALLLVLLGLLWRWAIVLLGLLRPAATPEIVLETMSASHYVEKVRWCMDRLGIDYTEVQSGGTLGAYYLGRTAPRLVFRTGLVRSQIGNSAEILRYLWGAYAASHGAAAAFLEPTAERIAFEQRIDRYGRSLQVWVYYHILANPELCKHLWGANNPDVPGWQRLLLRLLYPVQAFLLRRSFRISEDHYRKSCHHIEELLAEVDTALADGRSSILAGGTRNYTDLAFAAMSGPWLQPAGYGAGMADATLIERARAPQPMGDDIDRWRVDYPRAVEFIERLYVEERISPKQEE